MQIDQSILGVVPTASSINFWSMRLGISPLSYRIFAYRTIVAPTPGIAERALAPKKTVLSSLEDYGGTPRRGRERRPKNGSHTGHCPKCLPWLTLVTQTGERFCNDMVSQANLSLLICRPHARARRYPLWNAEGFGRGVHRGIHGGNIVFPPMKSQALARQTRRTLLPPLF